MRATSTASSTMSATPSPSAGVSVGPRGSASASVTGAAAAWATTVSSPRRTTVALDGHASTPSSANTAGAAIYDKQLLWKQHGQRKVEHKTLELLGQEDLECTFSPKINRSSMQPRKPSISTVASVGVSPAVSGGYVVAPPRRDFVGDGDGSECSSSQYSASSPRTVRSIESADLRGRKYENAMLAQAGCHDEDCDDAGLPLSAVALHPTESQEHSILLHLARQGRAREDAQRAQQKLTSTQPRKDFTKVTAARPFELSVSNRKPRRSTSASPTNRSARPRSRTASVVTASAVNVPNGVGGAVHSAVGPHSFVKRRSQGSHDDGSGGGAAQIEEDTNLSVATQSEALAYQWQQERSALLSIIETQRRELERRERAEEEAARLAETFSSAVQAFEQRLEVVERATESEMSEMKLLLAKQTAATDLILHALGLANPSSAFSVAPPPAPSSPASSSSASSRRETK